MASPGTSRIVGGVRWMPLVAAGVLLWCWVGGAQVADAGSATSEPGAMGSENPAPDGRELFEVHCSSCHGDDGSGVFNRGPDIREEGEAAADFVLRTGRMPMADPGHQAQRGPVRFTDAEITALVEFVGSMGDGPAIPEVDTADADVANGGRLFRLNCAACHVASGSGAIIGGGYHAPSLHESTPTEVAEAIAVGPGPMPIFSDLTEAEVADLAAYVEDLQRRDVTDVESLGGIGPVAEGLAAWLVAISVLVGLTRWIGSSHRARRRGTPEAGRGAPEEEGAGVGS